jgi:hypothetical protein
MLGLRRLSFVPYDHQLFVSCLQNEAQGSPRACRARVLAEVASNDEALSRFRNWPSTLHVHPSHPKHLGSLYYELLGSTQ